MKMTVRLKSLNHFEEADLYRRIIGDDVLAQLPTMCNEVSKEFKINYLIADKEVIFKD